VPPCLEEQIAGRSWSVGRCNPGQSHFSESVRAAGRTLILSVIAVALLVSRSTAVSPMREVRRVLIINDLGVISSPGFSEINQAVLTGLQKSPYRIELYEESLELTLFPDRVSQDRFREEIIQEYSARKPDVIIAAGPVSLKFIANLYDKFQGTPIIFCAIWGGIPDQLRHGMPFTGVLARLHPEGTLNAALHLLPSTKHVVVVGGVGEFDKGFEAIARQSFHNYESKLEFTYIFDLTMPALLERLKQLPSDTIVYHTAISQDAAGDRFIDSAQSIPMVASAANAPVFVMDDVDLRAGTVGGDLVNWADDGRIAAEMAARVLNGEKPQDIPVITSNHAYMFDWRALKRWGMNEKNLPPGSIVLNRQPTVWESYKWYIISGIALILLESLLIGGLVWQRAELKGSEERHRVIVEAASDAVISMDENGGILLANPATARIFGYDPVELIGRPLTILMPEFMRKLNEAGFRRYSATGERHLNWDGAEVTALRKNGQEFQVEVSFGEMTSNGHKVFTGFIRDISEKRRAEEQLHQAQEDLARVTRVVAMGELAAAIAHEVNQPLTAIVTNGNFCLRTLGSATSNPDELRAAITAIVNDGTRASGVISRIRGLLMKGSPNRTDLDINQIIQDITILLRNEFSRNRVSLRTELPSDLPRVTGDPVQLQQVLINLIMNAIEATSTSTNGRREILIRSAKNPDDVLVQVQDSGPGIKPELAHRIFEPFFTTKAKGIGMGLSISHSIIESHGGRLGIAPSSTGALFEFTLPTDDAGVS
jgi:PAS domain S-box-containing protein